MKTRLQLAKNVTIDLLFDDQKEFLGLEEIRIDGVRLRNPDRTVFACANPPEGL